MSKSESEIAAGVKRRRLLCYAWRACQGVIVVSALVHPVAGLLSRHSWVADLICHFQEPALVATLLGVLVTIRKFPAVALGLAILAAFQVVPVVRYDGKNPVRASPTSPERLRVLMANVLWDNERYGELIGLIRRERPDIIGLVEFTAEWRDALAEVRSEYPYRLEFPAKATGLALWFREPPLALDGPTTLTGEGWPFLHARFEFAGEPCDLWLAHPSPPVIRSRLRAGFPEFHALAQRVGAVKGSRVVVGDLNTTDGSDHFGDFLKVSGLRDSRRGFGRQGSWPYDRPYRIAIDHALVSNDLAVVARRLGPEIGSDHLPLIVDLAPAATRKAAAQSSQPAPAKPSP